MHNIGIVGIPPRQIIRELARPGITILDLDEPLVEVDLETTAPYLPKVYCAILRTVLGNALNLALDAIYVDVGPGKCDGALYVAAVLEELLPARVIRTRNRDRKRTGNPVCRSGLPLLEKLQRITAAVKSDAAPTPLPSCRPTAGFWGVPPRDFSILTLFPDSTHVYGWSRCMENKTPADHELEAVCNPEVPTVFFAQSFCAKTAMARLLAARHPRALCLDADVRAGASTKAKIQAFLELSGVCP